LVKSYKHQLWFLNIGIEIIISTGKHFETIVYPTLRQKLSAALNAWHPSDNSAKLMLQPWVNVFQQGYMEAFLIKNIVPKLQIALQSFVINPHHQQLGTIIIIIF
jgi:tuftelin-interacting protein 11